MGRLALITIACGVFAAGSLAQAPSRTFFEERLLDRAPVVVRAKFDTDQSCFDVDVSAFKVTHWLRGEADARILVLGGSQLSKQFKDLERLLFLRKEPSGCLYRVIDVIDLVGEADAIEAFVRGFLALTKEDEPSKRRAGLKQLIFDGLAMRSEFPRRLAVCELERLAQRTPPQISLDEVRDLEKLVNALPADEAARAQAALQVTENAVLKEFAGTQNGLPRGPLRNAYVRGVAEYLQDTDPARRAASVDHIALRFGLLSVPFLMKVLEDDAMVPAAARHLGALQVKSAVPRLLERLKATGEATATLLDSLGAIGDDSAVVPVSRYLSSAEHFEGAAVALARIGGPSAKRILDGLLSQLKRDPRQASRVTFLERARSKDFLDEDLEQRMEAKGRYPVEPK